MHGGKHNDQRTSFVVWSRACYFAYDNNANDAV